MFSAAFPDHRALALSRVLLIVAGVSFMLFLVGFIGTLTGFGDSVPPAGYFLGAAVLLTGLMLILSFWMLALIDSDATARRGRGCELQEPGVQDCPDSILQLDKSLRVVALNPAAERRFGYSLAAANGMPITFLLPKTPLTTAKTTGAALTRTTSEDKHEAKSFVDDKTQISAHLLAARTGTPLSHLVQPLLGYTELAIESLEPGHPVRGDLAEIGRASSRVVLLARSLEMFGGGGGNAQIGPVELNAFLDALAGDLRFVLQADTLLRFEKAETPVVAMLDPALTRLSVMLTACNAEEAMAPGSTVAISVTPNGGLQVADSGAGLAREVRIAMFRPLTSTKHAERGVGRGLYAARAAMRLQQGDLTLTQSDEAGSIVTLTHAREAGPPPRPPADSEFAFTTR